MIIIKSKTDILFQLLKPEGERLWKELTNANPWGFIFDCGKFGSFIVEPGTHIGSILSINGWNVRFIKGSTQTQDDK